MHWRAELLPSISSRKASFSIRIKMFLFTVLFLLLNAVQYSSCERFIIVPSPYSPCPGESTGEPCLTLEQYIAYPSLSSNITFELHPGNHRLDSRLSVLTINSFTMWANASVIVTCYQEFYFSGLQQIRVSGITFVGCRMHLESITSATFERNSFVNQSECCYSSPGAVLIVHYSSVLIRLCNYFNNHGAIYGSHSTFTIEQTIFRNNYPSFCCNITHGGAIHVGSGTLDILNSNFSSNSLSSRGHGGAIYTFNVSMIITRTYFSDNGAGSNGGHGGAVFFDGGNITVINSTFVNNTASEGRGGALYSARRYTEVSLVNNLFSHNTAAYCGVMAVAEFYHYRVSITGNTFTYNRAIQYSNNNGGGVFCIRNASVLVLDNIFSHNSAASDAGVIQVEESDIIIERSIFSNNTVRRSGGVLHTYFYPTRYTIINSFFTNNRAGSNGGVMYIGRAGSHMTICRSTFDFNNAANRGGVIFIIGSTLEINRANLFGNMAEIGEVINACSSDVTIITNPEVSVSQEPILLFCYRYDNSNTTLSRTTEQTIPTTASGTCINPLTEASTTTKSDALASSPTTDEGITNVTTYYEEASTIDENIIFTQSIPSEAGATMLESILPGYVAIGVSAVLLLVIAFVSVLVIIIAVKMFRVKTKSQNVNLSACDYPTIKNEYTPSDEHNYTQV